MAPQRTPAADPRVTKRKVTMQNYVALPPAVEGGDPRVEIHEATDYVRPDFLEAYVEDAKTRWAHVEVSAEPDAGPGGYHGRTDIPAGLDHPLAGEGFPATKED